MEFSIQRSKFVMFFVVCLIGMMFAYPVWMFVMDKGKWLVLLSTFGICFVVNYPIWEIFIKKHKVKNGVLLYGIWKDKIVLSDIKMVREVGKWMPYLEITTSQYKVHMIAVPQNKEKLLLLIQEANPL